MAYEFDRPTADRLTIDELIAQSRQFDMPVGSESNDLLDRCARDDGSRHATAEQIGLLRRLGDFVLSGVPHGWKRRNYPHV
ncbi:MAG: hypothetical protein AAFY73_14535 [Pseudomonadota bacterium]